MTTAIASEIDRRRGRPRRSQAERDYFALDLSERIRQDQIYVSRVRFPSDLYRAKPVEFFREVLGVEPWARQIEIIEAVRDHPRVAVCSGHKCGKSSVSAGIALWFFCSFTDARVVMTSTTSRQVDQILWRELRMMRARSGRCLACKLEDPEGLRIPRPCAHSTLIEGEQGDLARTGLKTSDFREIVGFTAREAEAVAGISGKNLLYIVDEASGVSDEIFQAIEGNRAGGARIVMLSNPTKNSGEFFDAFHGKARYYRTVRMSSEETPNVVQGREVIPGLATREWIDEKRDEWGPESPLYKVRVKGEHATYEEGKIFSVHAIGESEARWPIVSDAGRLYIGLDPAGETGRGDETMFAPRRGAKLLGFYPYTGLNEEQHFVRTLQLITDLRLPRETPVLVMDREGPIGTPLYRRFLTYLDSKPALNFELVGMLASHKPVRQPQIYDRLRDELTANLECWIRDGGAIVEDAKLAAEMHAMEWAQHVNGRLKVTPKEKLRKLLGRSPDRYDALSLACWEPLSLKADLPDSAKQAVEHDEYSHEHTIDPYAAGDMWRSK
jgi:phage terminase large subunit